jgi:oligopeptidase B
MEMSSKTLLIDKIENVYEDFEFSQNADCVYYTVLDEFERTYQVKRHLIGQDVSNDEVLFHEQDEMFFVTIKKTCDENYIIIMSTAQVTSEIHYCSSKGSNSKLLMLVPRIDKIRVKCEHYLSYFYIMTNEDGKNNWIYRIPASDNNHTSIVDTPDLRETVLEHRDFVLVEGFPI